MPPRYRNLSTFRTFSRERLIRADEESGMSDADIERRMAELERLLNDPDVRMDAHRVWTLLAELSRAAQPLPARG